jgi:large subunit ribosomal protein L19e
MKLRNKKALAAKTLGVGKARIIFVEERLEEIKEALTKQDIRDLHAEGAIQIKSATGRRKNVKRRNKKGPGKIKKKVKKRKQEYVKTTRKLRGIVAELKKQGRVSRDEFKEIRKKIRNRDFKSKAHLMNYIGELRK